MKILNFSIFFFFIFHFTNVSAGILQKSLIWIEKTEASSTNTLVVNLTNSLPKNLTQKVEFPKTDANKMMLVENLKIGDSVLSFNPISKKIESVKIIAISKKVISKVRTIVVIDLAWMITLAIHKCVKMSKFNPQLAMFLQLFLKQYSSQLIPFLIGSQISGFGHVQEIKLSPNSEIFSLSESINSFKQGFVAKIMHDVFPGAFLYGIQRGPEASVIFLTLAAYDVDLLKDPNAELIEEYFLTLERNQTVFIGDIGLCVNSLNPTLGNK